MEFVKTDPATIRTISILTNNQPGVLVRVCLVFSRRGYNIHSLIVSPTLDGRYSQVTIALQGDVSGIDQLIKHLNKSVDVHHASEHGRDGALQKELALIKVNVTKDTRTALLQLVEYFKAEAIDYQDDSIIVQITSSTGKLDAFIEMVAPYGIIEVARTGKIVMVRGKELT